MYMYMRVRVNTFRIFTEEELEIEDLFPDYEDEDEEGTLMLTTKEAICAIEVSGNNMGENFAGTATLPMFINELCPLLWV